eukprot:11224748-Lingulodinium_polyedra.AAC.1
MKSFIFWASELVIRSCPQPLSIDHIFTAGLYRRAAEGEAGRDPFFRLKTSLANLRLRVSINSGGNRWPSGI